MTMMSSAPAAFAPRTAALTSPVMSRRPSSYCGEPPVTCSQTSMPAMPSMSTQITTRTSALPHRVSGQETPRLQPGAEWPCPFLLDTPLRGLAFGDAEPANCHPSGCPSGVRFPSTKLAVGTFPREALAATPCACLAPQVLEQRAEVPPVGRP